MGEFHITAIWDLEPQPLDLSLMCLTKMVIAENNLWLVEMMTDSILCSQLYVEEECFVVWVHNLDQKLHDNRV